MTQNSERAAQGSPTRTPQPRIPHPGARPATGKGRSAAAAHGQEAAMRVLTVTPELPTPGRPGSMAPTARQIDSLRALGIDMDVLEITGLSKLKYPKARLTQHARLASADLIHAHFGYCGWLARSQRGTPVVVSFMGDDLLGTPGVDGRVGRLSRAVVRANRWLARWVDAVIVKSAEMARVVAPVEAHVVPNGVDMQTFQPMDKQAARATLGWTEEGRYVLFPGNPKNPRKGFDLAQRLVRHAAERTAEPIQLVPLWGVSPEQVPLYMNGCDAMVMTSLIEGSPNVVKEAMACNLPAVSVPVGDVPEMVRGLDGCGVDGYVVCPREAGVLGEALAELLTSGAPSGGRAALERKGLDSLSIARRVQRIYETVLSS